MRDVYVQIWFCNRTSLIILGIYFFECFNVGQHDAIQSGDS